MKIGKLTINPSTSVMELEDVDLSAKEIQDLNSLINSIRDLQQSYQRREQPTVTVPRPTKKEG
ncbi:unnamed protein product [marine sediment metagenome]|uniref:Uncharacterized protein n=1 Tax=marine sediment metagenome TaxID=412755 RepID=X1B3F3_9ZZZZ